MDNLRPILIFFVLLIHSRIGAVGEEFSIYWNIREFVSYILSGIVPCFFFISGFLYFYNIQDLSVNTYCTKNWRRVKSLLIPYLIWNAIVVICFASAHLFMGDRINPDFYNVLEYSPAQLLHCFWDCDGGMPINVPLWFLRDLFLFCLFSPIIWLVVKYGTKYVWILLILVSLIYSLNILYFSMGAYFSINKIDIIAWIERYWKWCLLFSAIGLLFRCAYLGGCFGAFEPISSVGNMLFAWGSIGLWWTLSLRCVQHGYVVPQKYVDSSFFIYVSHFIPMVLICYYALPKLAHLVGDIGCLCLYILVPLLVYVSLTAIFTFFRNNVYRVKSFFVA